MSIGSAFNWTNNPFYQNLASNKNALMQFGAGLASGNSFQDGIANGLTGLSQGAVRDDAMALLKEEKSKEQQALNQTTEWLRNNGKDALYAAVQSGAMQPAQAWQIALQEDAAARAGGGDNLKSVGGHLYDVNTGQWISPPQTAENRQNVSLTPTWGQDAAGNWVMLQPSSTGELVQSTVPEGVSLVNPYDLSAQRAGGTAFGKSTGGAQFDLPAAALTTEQTLAAIQSVRDQSVGMDEQFGNILGVPQQMLPTLPASERANFQIETNRLINRTFLEAREVLRGGGQITDFESRKAEGAISNLEEAMARGDKALFQKALNDLEQAVRDGYAKLQGQAGSMPGYGGPAPSSGPAPSGRVLTFNPATGRLE